MKNVLLILSTSRTSEKAIDFAVDTAKKESARLIVLYIIEAELTGEIFDKFSDVGFIGDKPSSQLAEAIMKEYRQRGYEETGKVQIKAMEAGISFDAVTAQGGFVEKALEVIDRHGVYLAVVARKKRSHISRYFAKSLVDELTARAGCKVEVFED